jgi:N-acetylglucosamine-6-phosphate deacetylase
MVVLAGGDLVLPDRILSGASLVIEDARIVAIEPKARVDSPGATVVEIPDCYVVPGFIDVHVHGVDGHDTLDEGDPVAQIASRLPRYGVTAFCPTTVACAPHALRAVLAQVAKTRAARASNSARVLPAHLESNFINPEYRGAQPAECLRLPGPAALDSAPAGEAGHYVRRPGSAQRTRDVRRPGAAQRTRRDKAGDFSARDILDVIAAARPDVGIVTLAPELPGGVELVRALVSAGHRVSLGHSGASLDEAMAAIDAGARHATHLFNRMAPMTHRAPGVAGAVLARDEVAAELICDGYHVHPAMSRIAIASKGVGRLMAITDGTAGSGLAVGSSARLGGRRIRVTEQAAVLDDGTLAGSTLTMDRAFRTIVTVFGFSVADAAMLCSTTPARELGLTGFGELVEGGFADVVVLDRSFRVVRTFIDGQEVYARQ